MSETEQDRIDLAMESLERLSTDDPKANGVLGIELITPEEAQTLLKYVKMLKRHETLLSGSLEDEKQKVDRLTKQLAVQERALELLDTSKLEAGLAELIALEKTVIKEQAGEIARLEGEQPVSNGNGPECVWIHTQEDGLSDAMWYTAGDLKVLKKTGRKYIPQDVYDRAMGLHKPKYIRELEVHNLRMKAMLKEVVERLAEDKTYPVTRMEIDGLLAEIEQQEKADA